MTGYAITQIEVTNPEDYKQYLAKVTDIVTILCDKSDKYNSKMFNKKFLQEKGLPFPSWI